MQDARRKRKIFEMLSEGKEYVNVIAKARRKREQECIDQPQAFPCTDGSINIPDRPYPSGFAERNLEQEDKEEWIGDEKEDPEEVFWTMSGG